MTAGLGDAGIDVRTGFDVDPRVRETYVRNNRGTRFVHADLRRTPAAAVAESAGNGSADDLLLAACAPCQPFSKQRNPDTASAAEGMNLLDHFTRIVEELRPTAVAAENVPGMETLPGGPFRRLTAALGRAGYH